MRTYNAKPSEIKRKWYVIDANGKTLGRLATQIARILLGKHKPEYTPFLDTGDYVVVINVAKLKITGNKAKDKVYHRHSGYPGGIKSITYDKLLIKAPERILKFAVLGMMPKGPLGRAMSRKLKIFADAKHPYAAQQPQQLEKIGA